MSKRVRAETKETPKLHLVPGGIELEEALPFSRDLLWLIVTYTFPIAPLSMRNEICSRTAEIKMLLISNSFGRWWSGHSIHRLGVWKQNWFWTIEDRTIGFWGVSRTPVPPTWIVENEDNQTYARAPEPFFACPSSLWKQLCLESPDGIIHKFKRT